MTPRDAAGVPPTPVHASAGGVSIPGLGPFVFVASALQLVHWLVVPMPAWLRVATLVACFAAMMIARRMLRGTQPVERVVALLVAWGATAVLFGLLFRHAGAERAPHLLYAAVLLLHGAVLLILLARPMPWPPASETPLLAGSLVVALLVAQAVLGGRAPQAQPGIRWEGDWVTDSLLGQRFASHSTMRIHYPSDPRGYFERADVTAGDTLGRSGTPDYVVHYAFNEFGCRDRDYSHVRELNTVRILGLGDSFMMGVGVHASDMFTTRLREVLEARAAARGEATRYEVINCGVSGYATREERLYYEHWLRAYRPDIVLLGMVHNDDRSWLDDVALGYVDQTGRSWWLWHVWKRITGAPIGRPPPNFDDTIWQVIQLDRAVRADGARLFTFAFRNRPFGPRHEANDWRTLVRSMEVGLVGSGIPFHDVGDSLLARHRPDELQVHPNDLHPNEIGHRQAAETVASLLELEGLLPLHTATQDRLSSGRANDTHRRPAPP